MYSVNLSPSHWLSFKSHYLVVQRVNKENGIRQWEDPEYCSMMISLILMRTSRGDTVGPTSTVLWPETFALISIISRSLIFMIFH